MLRRGDSLSKLFLISNYGTTSVQFPVPFDLLSILIANRGDVIIFLIYVQKNVFIATYRDRDDTIRETI